MVYKKTGLAELTFRSVVTWISSGFLFIQEFSPICFLSKKTNMKLLFFYTKTFEDKWKDIFLFASNCTHSSNQLFWTALEVSVKFRKKWLSLQLIYSISYNRIRTMGCGWYEPPRPMTFVYCTASLFTVKKKNCGSFALPAKQSEQLHWLGNEGCGSLSILRRPLVIQGRESY